jgi:Secretion system C-terminal sorting domain
LTYPYTAGSAPVYFAMRWIDLSTNQTRNITNDGPAAHLDDLAFIRGSDTLLFSSRNFVDLSIQKLNTGGFFAEQYRQRPSTGLSTTGTYRLSSFEPTDWQGKTYGAFQIWEGTGLPGSTEGEIWLTDLTAPHSLVRLNGINQVAVDPENVVGDTAVWVYYYGYTLGGPTLYNLYRTQTPLRQSVTSTDLRFSGADSGWKVYPTVVSDLVQIIQSNAISLQKQTTITVINAWGQIVSSQQIYETHTTTDTQGWASGLYFVNISWPGGRYSCRLVKP